MSSLESYVKKIEELSKANGIDLIRGCLSQEFQIPQIYCEGEEIEDVTRFVNQVSKLGASMLILEVANVEQEDIDSMISSLKGDEDASKIKILKRGLSFAGMPGFLRLSFISNQPNAVFQIELETELNSLLHDEDAEDDDDEYFDELDDVTIPKRKEIERFSNELANDKRFQSATNDSQRLLIAKRMFADQSENYDHFMFDQIMRDAMAIYEMDIKPSLDEALAEKAEKLLNDGLSKKDIAKKLDITIGRLSKLL